MSAPRQDPFVRFERNIERIPFCGCWLWVGYIAKDTGYGKTQAGSFCNYARPINAHRFSWLLHRGPIPSGLIVCHRCDVKPCVNPDHLFLGTSAANSGDMVRKGRSARGARNASAILTEQQVIEIRLCGLTQKEIAAKYGIREGTVSAVKNATTWKHVVIKERR